MIHRCFTICLMMSVLIPLAGFSQRADLPVNALAANALMMQTENTVFYTVREYGNDIAELQRRVDASFVDQPRKQVLLEIARQGNLGLAINAEMPVMNESVTLEFANTTVADALHQTLATTPFEAAISRHREILIVNRPLPTRSQTRTQAQQRRTITGNIVDAVTDEPLIGVSILVEGTASGTTTDFDGNYSLVLPEGGQVLVVSYIGYRTQNVEIGDRSEIDIRLEPDVLGLDDLVVVGYGVQQRREVTGSIASVSMEQISRDSIGQL